MAPLPPGAVAASDGTNLLLIVFDTLRADHLSLYGYGRPTSPNLAELAARGTTFERATAQFQETRPSHVSLLTGLYPPAHGVVDNDTGPCPLGVTTLAEILAARGYTTAAIVGNPLLQRSFGLDQGFATYDDSMPKQERNRPHFREKTADQAADAALAWLAARPPGPFFLFLHFQDVHGPYDPPAPWNTRFASDGFAPTGKVLERKDIPLYQRFGDARDHDGYVARYDAEIAFADAQVGRVLGKLRELGLEDDTLVVFTSDHGETLGERGVYYLHHLPIAYEEVLRQPLILAGPGIARGRRVRNVVEEVDVMPTVLDRLSIEVPAVVEQEVQGRSFAPWIDAAAAAPAAPADGAYGIDDVAFATARAGLEVVRTSRFKLIVHPVGNRLYDLDRDPGEERNVIAQHKDVAARLLDLLGKRRAADAALRARFGSEDAWTEQQRAADRRQMEALGYTEGH